MPKYEPLTQLLSLRAILSLAWALKRMFAYLIDQKEKIWNTILSAIVSNRIKCLKMNSSKEVKDL